MANNVYKGQGAGKGPGNNRRSDAERERAKQKSTESVRRYADDDYDDEDYEWNERETSRKARNGCLIAFLVFLLVILAALIVGALIVKSEIDGNNSTATEAVVIEVASGYGGRTMGDLLEENGIIGNGTIFRFYVQFKDVSGTFIAGRHTFTPGMTYDEILSELSTSPPPRETVTIMIPEGYTIMAVANLFEENGLCSAAEFLAEANQLENFSDITFVQKILEDFNPTVFHAAEGYLFPDTYSFFKDDTVHNFVRKLYEQMDAKVTPEMYARMAELGMSLREVITMASMIQKESGDYEQQPGISQVFWNRLGDDWQAVDGTMGSDVTVHYIRTWMQWNLPEYADVKRTDISYDEAKAAVGDDLFYAYCTDITYPGVKKGLPNGPICAVSENSIQAALYPDADYSQYYYFVADAYGAIYYAETLQEHNKNIQTANKRNEEFAKEQEEAAQQENEAEETAFALPLQDITTALTAKQNMNYTIVHTPPKWGRMPLLPAGLQQGGAAA